MQSGSIAAVAFVYGDYASFLIPASPAVHAALAIAALSALQLKGTEIGIRAQLALTIVTLAAVSFVAIIGLVVVLPSGQGPPAPSSGAVGLAMVFILLTYGGWSETAYLSGEVRDARRDIPRALIFGTAIVTALYLFANYSYVRALGIEGLRQSDAIAANLVGLAFGDVGAAIIAGVVCVASLSTLNATILTGARSMYALGRSFPPLAVLGQHSARGRTPRNAILVQAIITIGLVVFGAFARDGFQSMVEYTAPVFWFFLLMVGISLFVFRWRAPEEPIPFRVPLYPLTPLVFCATSLYLLYSSLAYTGFGALIGTAIFLTGIPILLIGRRISKPIE
jgi:amino acid transporter